jgi:hypothetical protein
LVVLFCYSPVTLLLSFQLLAMEAAARAEVAELETLAVEISTLGSLEAYAGLLGSQLPLDPRHAAVSVDTLSSLTHHIDALFQVTCDRQVAGVVGPSFVGSCRT